MHEKFLGHIISVYAGDELVNISYNVHIRGLGVWIKLLTQALFIH